MAQNTFPDDNSPTLLNFIEQQAGLGVFRHELLTDRLECSDQLRTMLGLPPSEAPSVQLLAACFAEHELVLQAFASPDPANNMPLSPRDGGVPGWRLHLLPIHGHQGNWLGHAGFIVCIGDVSELDASLRRQTAYLEAILAHLPQGITVFDEQLRLKHWNKRATEVLDLPDEIMQPDVSFEDLIRVPAERGEYGPGDPKMLVEERRKLALRFKAHCFERTRPNGRTHIVAGEPLMIDDRVAGFITTYTDITDRKAIERAVEQQSQTLRTIIDNIPCGVSLIDKDLKVVEYNDELKRVLNFPDSLFASGPPQLHDLLLFNAQRGEYGPGDPQVIAAELVERARHPRSHSFERVRPDGKVIHVSGQPLSNGSFVTIYNDVTELRRASERQALADKVFEHTPDAVLILSPDKSIISVNPAFTDITAFDRADVVGKPFLPDERESSQPDPEKAWDKSEMRGCYTGESCGRRKAGSSFPRELSLVTVRDRANGRITHYIAIFTDITERKIQEAHIEHLAHHDPLTGLANRFALHDRLDHALAHARRNGRRLAVLFLDLDRFKNINDSLGHHAGDNVLVQVGQRLRSSVRDSDTVARQGGDEFVVVLQDVDDVRNAALIAGNLMQILSEPYSLGDMELHAIPSIGISLFPDDAEDTQGLLRNADAAMYHAKALGRGNFQFFDKTLTSHANERLRLEARLRRAVAKEEFELWYQPVFETRSGALELAGFEALLRWRNQDGTLIPPGDFIPLAEETGIIVPLGDWVISEACRQLSHWRASGHDSLRLAINLSARQLREETLSQQVAMQMRAHALEAGALEFEITESSVMTEPDKAIEILKALKICGAALSIDDFGTGYSSLSYLKRFPLDRLKIDRSFVSDIETDANDAAIVNAAVSLAHGLGLQVVAEGVESAAQVERLTELGCDELQGFFLGKPMPAAAVDMLLLDKNR